MRKLWKVLFVMPSRHRSGYIQLLFLASFYILLKLIYNHYFPSKPISFNEIDIDSLVVEMDKAAIPPFAEQDSLFPFDPNSASFVQLTRLGISDEVSNRIIKYRQKGGQFNDKEDLLKIYGFDQALFKVLETYIETPKVLKKNKDKRKLRISSEQAIKKDPEINEDTFKERSKLSVRLNLNTADSISLIRIYGIGPIISSGIIKYREKLGGYTSLDQLYEVYNMNDERYEEMKKYCYIDEGYEPRKISINNDDFKTLLRHPYFKYNTVKNLFNYRDQHGEYISIDELRNLFFMTDSLFLKVKPYLSL